MSVRYNYSKQVSPPAPFVYVTVTRPDGTDVAIPDQPAQLDTGADLSVIPSSLVDRLQLVQLDQVPVAGFAGHLSLAPTYLIRIAVQPFVAIPVRAIADREEPFILLGRDVLNHFKIELDGRNLIVSIRLH